MKEVGKKQTTVLPLYRDTAVVYKKKKFINVAFELLFSKKDNNVMKSVFIIF